MFLERTNKELDTILNSSVTNEDKKELILNIFGYSNLDCKCLKKKISVEENVYNRCNRCKGAIYKDKK